MEVKAVSKYVRISPRKVHIMIGAVKGKPIEIALEILKFMPQKAAAIVEKIIRSAVSNADQHPDIDVDSLSRGLGMISVNCDQMVFNLAGYEDVIYYPNGRYQMVVEEE